MSATNTGSILITSPVVLAMAPVPGSALNLSWPQSAADVVVEQADSLGANSQWTVVTNLPVITPDGASVALPVAQGTRFYRVRQPW